MNARDARIFLAGCAVYALLAQVVAPRVSARLGAAGREDAALRAFDAGLATPAAARAAYLPAYLARAYARAEATDAPVGARCAIASAILAYARDPALRAQRAAILAALPPNLSREIAQANDAAPWYARIGAPDTGCLAELGAKLDPAARAALADADPTVRAVVPGGANVLARPRPRPSPTRSAAVPVLPDTGMLPDVAGPAVALPATPPPERAEWRVAPTRGALVGRELVAVDLRLNPLGRVARIRNVALTPRAETVRVELLCRGCPPQLRLDAPRGIDVPPSPPDRPVAREMAIPTFLPIELRFRARPLAADGASSG